MTRLSTASACLLLHACCSIASAADVHRPQQSEMRVWTDASGSYRIQASLQYVDRSTNVVYLQRPDGNVFSCPWTRLSLKDRNYTAAQLALTRRALEPIWFASFRSIHHL